jgi:hypothetical protein
MTIPLHFMVVSDAYRCVNKIRIKPNYCFDILLTDILDSSSCFLPRHSPCASVHVRVCPSLPNKYEYNTWQADIYVIHSPRK